MRVGNEYGQNVSALVAYPNKVSPIQPTNNDVNVSTPLTTPVDAVIKLIQFWKHDES